MEIETVSSPQRAIVATSSALRIGLTSSITFQCSSGSSSVHASVSLVMLLSERIAVIAHLCSNKRSNISISEIQQTLPHWTSERFWRPICFSRSEVIALLLWWKWATSLPHAQTMHSIVEHALNPSCIASCSEWAMQHSDSHSRSSFAFIIFDALLCATDTTLSTFPSHSTISVSSSVCRFCAVCLLHVFCWQNTGAHLPVLYIVACYSDVG